MSDFLVTWQLARQRFDDAASGLSAAQLNWTIYPGSLSIAQMALHVAGVEVSFGSQLQDRELEGLEARLKAAATNGVVNENPFPFAAGECTPELVAECLALGRRWAEALLADPDPWRSKEIVSALGPRIDGTGALLRLAQHPAYHQGQAYQMRQAPGFPAA